MSYEDQGTAHDAGAAAHESVGRKAAPNFKTGDVIRFKAGGPILVVASVHNDDVRAFWFDNAAQMQGITLPAECFRPA